MLMRDLDRRSRETSRQSSVNSGLARPSPRSNLWVGARLAGAASALNQPASRQPAQSRKLSTNRDLNRIKLLSSLRGSDSHKDLNKIKDLNDQEQLHNHKDLNNQEPACSLRDLNSPEYPKLKTLHKTRDFPLSNPQDLSSQGLYKDLHPSCRTVKVCKGLNRGNRTT